MSSKVKICARLRPKLPHETDDGGLVVEPHPADSNGGGCVVVPNPRDQSQLFRFPFTSAWLASATQEQIFTRDVKPLIEVVFTGVTVTIFAYGVTSSGKTHTMQGTPDQPGVIPRVVDELFLFQQALQAGPTTELDSITLSATYMEIYKDECYDLLVARETAPKLPVRENEHGQVFVANLSRVPLASSTEFAAIYSKANTRRSTGSTNLNRASSRSHAVLTIEVLMRAGDVERTGKINLVDLAGSENNKHTGNDPSRMAESAAINRSLSVLGNVVHALNTGASRIPYRDSKLTRILQDALGGRSVGLLICNIAPSMKFRQDTLNTLNFAVRTKNVENKPVVHERDVARAAPKPHFAAIAARAPKLPPAVLPPSAIHASDFPSVPGGGDPTIRAENVYKGGSIGRSSGRQSMVPRTVDAIAGGSRVPRRLSVVGSAAFQPFAMGVLGGVQEASPSGSGSGSGGRMSDEEIEERIAKAVEREVRRRLEEREREMSEREEKERALREEREREMTMMVDVPMGDEREMERRHADLDGELKRRLEELEKKMEKEDKEVQLADVLSPVSRKKTGRAYVALARAHSDKGDLNMALDLYKKAATYVPDNAKLRDRIVEIEWAAKNGRPFQPTPKKKKRAKVRTDDEEGEEEGARAKGKGGARKRSRRERQQSENEFGTEVTNVGTGAGHAKRRSVEESGVPAEGLEAPAKKRTRGGRKGMLGDEGSIEEEPEGMQEDEDAPAPVAVAF